MHRTIRVLKDEHAALSVMLSSVLLLPAQCRRTRTLPDSAVLRAMPFYLDGFPQQQHRRTESEALHQAARALRLHAACSTVRTMGMQAVAAGYATGSLACVRDDGTVATAGLRASHGGVRRLKA